MSHEIRADYGEQYLFPPALEDWVGEDHPARFVRDLIDSMDLEAMGFRVRKEPVGRPNYGADLLLKAWVYGYLLKIRSSRELERACRETMGLIWLTGRNYPDHNTLWRFWRDNRKAIREVYRKSLQVAFRAELIGLVLHAVDGTKIGAWASKQRGLHLADWQDRLAELETSIDEVMGEIESREECESGEYRLPEALEDEKQRKERIVSILKEMKDKEEKHRHEVDEECRMMESHERCEWAYNAQAVVDAKSGMIVAAEVTNEATDHQQMVPMVEQVEKNLGHVAEENVADAGYRSGEQLSEAQKRGYSVLTSGHGRSEDDGAPYHKCRFQYDPVRDCYICPRGESLPFSSEKRNTKRHDGVRIYRCRSYRNCPVRGECTRAKVGRTISIHPHEALFEEQRKKRSQPEKQIALAKRKTIVEPVFGIIKQALQFRRWSFRGLESVRTQWAMLCLTVNLWKMLRSWRTGVLKVR